MEQKKLIIILIIFFVFISFFAGFCLFSVLSIFGGVHTVYNSNIFDGIIDKFDYVVEKVEYYGCEAKNKASAGGVLGKDSKCHDPDGLNLAGGEKCPNGDNSDCRSGYCKCSAFLASSGPSCHCAYGRDDPKSPGGTPCPTGDDMQCKSGHCNCAPPSKTGPTCICTSTGDGTDLKLGSGERCTANDDRMCASGECKCKGTFGLGLVKSRCFCK